MSLIDDQPPEPGTVRQFDYTEYPLPAGTVVDASAGTGKTYAVAAHVTLALAMSPELSIGQVLITTFTRNAAAELRDRVRRRLVTTAGFLRGAPADRPDELDESLRAGRGGDPREVAARLERAAAEFDTATIATIHAVCTKVLALAGLAVSGEGREDVRDRIVAEVVNDEVVKESVAGHAWDEGRIVELVDAAAGDPFLEAWIEPGIEPESRADLGRAADLVARCVRRVHDAMRAQPSFDDLLRLAWDVVSGAGGDAVVRQLRERFALAIIDEAQDNDPLQWRFFRALFPGTDGRRLITVGDPKQAIYAFRGADVGAYVDFTASAERRTLPINRRTDGPLVAALNQALAGATFHGSTVAYSAVEPDERNAESRIVGVAPFEIIGIGPVTGQVAVVEPAVRKVVELLDPGRCGLRAGDAPRPVRPGDICVMVRANWVGNLIAARLAACGIRAVTAGTASVMKGGLADDVRSLLEALERPSSPGRVRRGAVTRFFGNHSLRDAGTLAEEAIRPVQDRVAQLAETLQHHGVAAMAAVMASDAEMMKSLTAGPDGERHLADFAHVMELLHEHGPQGGCRPDELLAAFRRLLSVRDDQELVSRRVESDDDAVAVMTVHAAKGLEFPCVVVADPWKAEGHRDVPAIFHDATTRMLDMAYARGSLSPTAAERVTALGREEQKRLFYVALTRAQHHLCVIRGVVEDSILPEVLRHDVVPARGLDSLPRLDTGRAATRPRPQLEGVALLPVSGVQQTYRRTSFSGITAQQRRTVDDDFLPPGSGHDEAGSGAVSAHDQGPTAAFQLPDLPAGTAFGSVVHEIFERIDTTRPLEQEVAAVVAATATSTMFAGHHAALAETIVRSLRTPFGGPLGTTCFADIGPGDRLAELDFEMALPGLDAGVLASDVGRVLAGVLPPNDPLHTYAATLRDPSFGIPLCGMINGSIDAVLRLPADPAGRPRVVIADYKTNKLHSAGMPHPEAAYAAERLVDAMAEHHYPLQAVVYGTAVYRWLRWRLREEDPSDCLAGIVYTFIRGTRGADAPADAAGRRHGMFVWQPPRSLWPRMSHLFAGERP